MIPAVQEMHAPLTRLTEKETLVCKYCQELAAASAQGSSGGLLYLDHHPSILSFKESSERCPLCWQLLQWINKETLEECRTLEINGCSTEIHFIGLVEEASADAQTFQGILNWIFGLSTFKKSPMKRGIWSPT